MKFVPRLLTVALALTFATPALAQWTNRYPRVAGYGHQVYLEGYELPLLTNGPIDAVASPDGTHVAFASRGWIWILDRATRTARRVTSGAGIDARPTYSPDGTRLAFVRDENNDTTIVVLDLRSEEEQVLVDTGSIDMDPAFTPDGSALVYASAAGGSIDVWVVGLDGSEAARVTQDPGLEVAPRPTRDGGYVYLAKTRGGVDELHWRQGNDDQVLLQARIASQARPALDATTALVAINVPVGDETHLLAIELAAASASVRLAPNATLPLTPAWTANGAEVLYSEADAQQRLHLYAAPLTGAPSVEVPIEVWDWAAPTATVRVRTRLAGTPGFSAARLSAWSGNGHPLVAEAGLTYLDGQSGWPFFYSTGDIEFTVPAGQVSVVATQGISTAPRRASVEVPAGGSGLVEIDLTSVWAAESEWSSGDHHFHLNYGGAYNLPPRVLTAMAAGEGLDVPTPLTANLHNRYADAEHWGWSSGDRAPLARFGQEIRSHFLGHIALLGGREMQWPWIWGPGYQVYGRDDRTNASVLDEGRDNGAVGYYVHPVSNADPFGEEPVRGVPIGIVADAVLGHLDALEVACLWSDEVGTSELWYRFLNAGIPIAPSAGTDVMMNLVRTMAAGTTRVYVHQPEGVTWDGHLAGLRAGRSFVTNGPMLDFQLTAADGVVRPGGAVPAGPVEYELTVATATAVELVEVVVNGQVVATEPGLDAAGSRVLRGRLELPAGGWVAVRASGGRTEWPAMDSYPWAHTAPIWIGEVGSTQAEAQRLAVADLRRALDVSEARLEAGYAGADIPQLRAHFARARERLNTLR
jgi:TolB protein